MTWKQALTRAINAEVAAEKAATQAEDERRRTWWDTTWALAGVPRAEWGEAQAEYVRRTNHSASTAKNRRSCGERLSQSTLGSTLPMPRFAQAAANWIGAKADEAKVLEAIRLLADAEKNEQSLREFSQALTGKSWTNAPENMTEADEDAVVEKVARTRPSVIAKQTRKPSVAREVVEDPEATRTVHRQSSAKTRDHINKRKQAITAAGPDPKGQLAAVPGPSGAMDMAPEYTQITSGLGQMWNGWIKGIKGQKLKPFDRHLLGADLSRMRRLIDEIAVFVEAEDDPYEAVAQHRAAYQEQLNRETDQAEGETTFDDWDEIEKFANEGA